MEFLEKAWLGTVNGVCTWQTLPKRNRPPEPLSGGGACVCSLLGYIAGTIPPVVASIGWHGEFSCLPRRMLIDQVIIGNLSPKELLTYSKVSNDCQICKRIKQRVQPDHSRRRQPALPRHRSRGRPGRQRWAATASGAARYLADPRGVHG